MTFHVFVDGTGNNMFNTEHRLEDKKKYKEAQDALSETATNKEKVIGGEKAKKYDHLKGQISFENDLSNPAILYKASEDNQSTIRRIYIEGAGTIREQVDDRSGLAAAMGPSGIMVRVHEAYSQVKIAIKNNKNNTNTLIFNVFGFSRGSFYGRYFVALLKQEPKEADQAAKKHPIVGLGDPKVIDKQNKLPIGDVPMWTNDYDFKSNGRALIMDYGPNKVIVNFVGIYDTVAAHGFSHHDDSLKFFFDIGNKQSIKKLVHITAENEYRNHFALVDTNREILIRVTQQALNVPYWEHMLTSVEDI